MTNTIQTIHLQSLGSVPAIPVGDVQAGDVLVWNFGHTSEVVDITPVTAKTVELTTRAHDGSLWTQRKRATTLVARAGR